MNALGRQDGRGSDASRRQENGNLNATKRQKRLELKRRWALTTFFISMCRYGIGDMGYGRWTSVKIFFYS